MDAVGRTNAIWAASAILLMFGGTRLLGRSTFVLLAITLLTADLFAFGINYNPTCDRSKVYPETPLTNKLQSIANDSRIAPINPSWSLFTTPDAMLPPNAAMVYGLYDVQGYDSLFLRSYQRELALVEGTDPSPPENGNMVLVRRNTPLLWKAAGTILTNIPLPQLPPGVEPLGTCAGVYLYRASEPEGFADVLAKAHVLDPELASFWPVGVYPEPGNPNKMSAEFLRGPTYPGWKMIHDRGEKLDRFWEVGLAALPGQETARFVFEPFSFRLGLFLMFVGVSALACVGIYRQLKNRSTMSQ
ncbi:MAG: hypothetical protein A2Z18_02975 [Armatimonadetes bacterium RBG_16_58_9]|nr:MAG: hypothetical protein A2Z18_02975 [Armatimonadetes bacterium RBG_16_58_9]